MSADGLRILLAAEGSGGHVVPALEVAQALLESGARVGMVYAQRPQTEALFEALMAKLDRPSLARYPVTAAGRGLRRLRQAGAAWRVTRRAIQEIQPQAVVGFGGAFCVPVALEARRRGLPVLLHEQNVAMGRANRWLRRWVSSVAVSFEATRDAVGGRVPCRVTGMPVRASIGRVPRDMAAAALGLDPHRLTVLVLGGSQGSQAINRMVIGMLGSLTEAERVAWQVVHLTGADGRDAAEGYRRAGVRHWVGTHLAEMATAYAVADVAVSRAGASTVVELAQAGVPAVLVPYPLARAHQRHNAQAAAQAGGALVIEESACSPAVLLAHLRLLLGHAGRRASMGLALRALAQPDATQRVVEAVMELAGRSAPTRRPAVRGVMRTIRCSTAQTGGA
jgi:UDP-N-acetylglucosamine--N-acetylmuramyl-(pentapeptide) pyrophosphoryl-undecaprenol N-acetylglucosamine transferase